MNKLDTDKDQTIANRRGFLSQATELFAAVPLVGYAATNWNKQDQYKVLVLDGARMPERPLQERTDVEKLFTAQSRFTNATEALKSDYRRSYHKSRTVMVPQFNGKTTTMRPQTTYYWAVPKGLPEQSTVSTWQTRENDTQVNISGITKGKLLDIEKLKEVAIGTKKGNDTARQLLTGLVYGSSVGMLWGYEEAIAFVKSKANDTSYHHERFEKTTATQETRRGFIKVGAALLGAGVAAVIHNDIQTRLSNGEQRLEGELRVASNAAEQSVDTAIKQYYGETPEQMIQRVEREVNQAEVALLSGKADRRVSNALGNFVRTGRDYLEDLKAVSENTESRATLAYLAKCKMTTDQLEAASTSDERIATSAALLEGAGIVGAMALVVVPGRVLNQRFPGEKDLYSEHNED